MPRSTSNELQARIKEFVFNLLKTIKDLPRTEENIVYRKQIIRSASSIGANYAEAQFAQTKQEFLHCMNISRKEANETLYWLDLLYNSNPTFKEEIGILRRESEELLKIFISSVKTIRKGLENEK